MHMDPGEGSDWVSGPAVPSHTHLLSMLCGALSPLAVLLWQIRS